MEGIGTKRMVAFDIGFELLRDFGMDDVEAMDVFP